MADDNSNEDEPVAPGELFDGIEDAVGTDWSGSLLRIEERPRGLLSHTDREFLAGLKDYKHDQSESNRRQDIRDRVTHGLQDFLLLWCLLEDDQLAKIFASLQERQTLNDSLAAAIAFIYRGLDQDATRLESIVEDGVYAGANLDRAGRWAGDIESVDASIDLERNPNVTAIYDRFKRGEAAQLSPTEIGVLVRAGKIEPEDLDELEAQAPEFPGVYFGDGMAMVATRENEGDAESE